MGEWEDHDIGDPLEIENRNVGSCLTSSKKGRIEKGVGVSERKVYMYIYMCDDLLLMYWLSSSRLSGLSFSAGCLVVLDDEL